MTDEESRKASSVGIPYSPEWHAELALLWRREIARRAERLIAAQEELNAARQTLREHELLSGHIVSSP